MISTVNDRWYIDPALKVVVVEKQSRPVAAWCSFVEALRKVLGEYRAGKLNKHRRSPGEVITYIHLYRMLQPACHSPSTGKWGDARGVGQDHSDSREGTRAEALNLKTHAFSRKLTLI